MYIEFGCPHCRGWIKVLAEYAGRPGQCPYCRAVVQVPGPGPVEQGYTSGMAAPPVRGPAAAAQAPDAEAPDAPVGYAEPPPPSASPPRSYDDAFAYDRPRRRRKKRLMYDPYRHRRYGGFDDMMAKTPVFVLILFAVLCGGLAFWLGLIGIFVCKHPVARSNSVIVVGLSMVWTGVLIMLLN
jgi:hypothetical protein